MLLQKISFKNFRNFQTASFDIDPSTTIVIGENARGKTNLLEGIYFLANGVGFRESKEEEFVNFESQNQSMIVEGVFVSDKDKTVFTINLLKRGSGLDKIFQIQRTKRKHADYLRSQIRTVLFSPDQIEIITGSPDRRRDYFNKFISSCDLEYKKKLRNYETALRKRNKVLEYFTSIARLKEDLFFWDSYLEEQASYVTQKRSEYVDLLNQNQKIDGAQFTMLYLKSEITQTRLSEYFDKEIKIRRTLIGPQKDDFLISMNDHDVHKYGSRSAQRFAIFWLKINELKHYEALYGRKPLLLLDDIFSELDHKNRKLVTSLIGKYQTIATTTESGILELLDSPKSIIKL